jgi:hypothetical protein
VEATATRRKEPDTRRELEVKLKLLEMLDQFFRGAPLRLGSQIK